MAKSPLDEYDKVEAQARFEAALRGGLNTPHKPLAKAKAKKTKKKRAKTPNRK